MKRLRMILTVAFGILCVFLAIIFSVSYHLPIWDTDSKTWSPINFIAVTSHFHVRFYLGGLWFSSDELPYMGSIRHLSDEKGIPYEKGRYAHEIRDGVWRIGEDYGFGRITYVGEQNEFVGRDICGDLPGIYYRHFVWWKEKDTEWTLMISLWYPILLFAIAPAFWIFRRWHLWIKNKGAA